MSNATQQTCEITGTEPQGPDELSNAPGEDLEGLPSKLFEKLLRDLAHEHERALRTLHVENKKLRRELALSPAPRPPSCENVVKHGLTSAICPPQDSPPGWVCTNSVNSNDRIAARSTSPNASPSERPTSALKQSVASRPTSISKPSILKGLSKRGMSIDFCEVPAHSGHRSGEKPEALKGEAVVGGQRGSTGSDEGNGRSIGVPSRGPSLGPQTGDTLATCHEAPNMMRGSMDADSANLEDDCEYSQGPPLQRVLSWHTNADADQSAEMNNYFVQANSITRRSFDSDMSGMPVHHSASIFSTRSMGGRNSRERAAVSVTGVSIEAVATRQGEMNRALQEVAEKKGQSRSRRASMSVARQDVVLSRQGTGMSVGHAWSMGRSKGLLKPGGRGSAPTSAMSSRAASPRGSLLASSIGADSNSPSMVQIDTDNSLCTHPPTSDHDKFDEDGFDLKPVWQATMRMNRKKSTGALKMACTIDFDSVPTSQPVSRFSVSSNSQAFAAAQSQGAANAMAEPRASLFGLIWQFIGLSLICWDVVYLPMGVFEPEEPDFFRSLVVATIIFWTLDLIVSFFSSYSENGVAVTDVKRIVNHYLRTWFPFDVLIVTIDWFLVTIDSKTGTLGSVLGVLRIVRILRLMRFFKCRRVFDEVHNHINSEYTSIVASIVKLVGMLLIANHFIACAWYGIGKSCDQANLPNWLAAGGFLDQDFAYSYTTSMHWSLTQFTPASMEVQPRNVPERTFTIVVIVIALVCFSSFLSSITSSITQLRSMTEDDRRQFWLLRKFFMDSYVPVQLASRITRYLEYATAHRKAQVQESQIKILSLLSDQLHRELQCATRVPHVQYHPLFSYINCVSNVTMHRLAAKAFSRISLASGDPLFFQGELATLMFFVIDGEFQYVQGSIPRWVASSEWMCEPVLWTLWIHPGEMLAMTESEVLSVDAEEFAATVQANPAVWKNVREYAEDFCKNLNLVHGSDLSDLRCLDPDFEDNLCSRLGFERTPEKASMNAATLVTRFFSVANFFGRAQTNDAAPQSKRRSVGKAKNKVMQW